LKNIKTKPLHYICIEGNIGSGKSTLAKALAKELKATYLPEVFEESNLLPLFYDKPKQFSFPLEYSFLISRFEQIYKALKDKKQLIVADYSIYKCLWFAKINLSKKDFLFFEKHFNVILNELPKPDLMVHISTDIANLQKNIKKRGRSFEQKIDSAYLTKIEKQYKKGIKQIKVDNVLEITVENYYPKLEADVIEFVTDFIKNLK
jgi:deoxyadenosine/deoxycytidine kinase